MTEEIPGVNMAELRLQGFKVHELPALVDVPAVHGRRDFYKMGLVTGEMTMVYGDRVVELKDTVLFFVNPRVPRSVLRRSTSTTGYACIFTEAFMPAIVKKSPLFNAGQNPLIRLNSEQAAFMRGIFGKMLAARDGDYAYKSDLIKSCIEIIIHEALSIQPPVQQPVNGAARMAHLFMDLLERQFPIEHTAEPLKLRTAQDFAAKLAVHINYLNRAVKTVTGKPTSVHIAERIAAEAKALLQHTDWGVADIAYALGFGYPTYFNNFFKRVTGVTPKSLRKV
ncbi:helix-turn-helix domain-containing protein [Mucilaginibacter gotjawali]|uniref:AraC-like DNA-binding protein n=2 Tax=Mucilaginibacter gotjawali TaxID=1550579 RepID=A0A839SNA6_9SPHI|nr:helix-turn-helix domain-containing protein [Mucilaginibacter gotjawali]MBB3058714.1 AraC-like DNA-binding protein [Mucilaginibacter gotjawali]BAU55682.1 HTH-type transcriptional regulator ChbR [Mucilaginibacter gotjawali]